MVKMINKFSDVPEDVIMAELIEARKARTKEVKKQYYQKNKAVMDARTKQYLKTHPEIKEKWATYDLHYRQKHAEKLKKYRSEYYHSHKELPQQYNQTQNEELSE